MKELSTSVLPIVTEKLIFSTTRKFSRLKNHKRLNINLLLGCLRSLNSDFLARSKNQIFNHDLYNRCPHFGKCSGCSLQKIFEPPSWIEIKHFFGCYSKNAEPMLFVGDFGGCRFKSKLATQKKLNGSIAIGLYKENSHKVVDIPYCLVHHPQINNGIALVKEALSKFKMSIYSEKTKKGLIRYFQLFVQRKTNKIQLSIVLNTEDINVVKKNALFFDFLYREEGLFDSVWINLNEKDGNAIFSNKWLFLKGKEQFWQRIGKIDFLFHPMSFAQSNIVMFEKLIQFLEKELLESFSSSDLKKKKILELYAGTGAIGLNLAHLVKEVMLVEKNPFSKVFFKSELEITNLDCLIGEVKEIDLELNEYDIIIVDPPRKGLDEDLLKKLCLKKGGTLIYVSCFFKNFKRDCELLVASGWKIKKGNGFLFFPGTDHVEILGILEK
jgi:23S rRNA (uracil1939-C5)-methyltransferase